VSTITASRTTTSRSATAAVVGGVLWALVPVVFDLADAKTTPRGSLTYVAVAVVSWLCGAVSLALLLAGVAAVRSALGDRAGRLGATGTVVTGLGFLAMLAGMGTELTTITFTGNENDTGHTVFLLGFLVTIVGEILLGSTVFRRRTDRLGRTAGLLMALALPVGVVLLLLVGFLFPGTDAGFWAAFTVPTGIAWVLLGRSLASPSS
jgi:hypothetical protein